MESSQHCIKSDNLHFTFHNMTDFTTRLSHNFSISGRIANISELVILTGNVLHGSSPKTQCYTEIWNWHCWRGQQDNYLPPPNKTPTLLPTRSSPITNSSNSSINTNSINTNNTNNHHSTTTSTLSMQGVANPPQPPSPPLPPLVGAPCRPTALPPHPTLPGVVLRPQFGGVATPDALTGLGEDGEDG